MRVEHFVGIDLSASTRRPSACAALCQGPRIEALAYHHSDGELQAFLEGHLPCLTGIDAPLFLPRGLCCLEPTCSCQPSLPDPGRRAERALSKRRIGCFYVTKRSFAKPWIYRGLSLRERLEGLGYPLLEVYPYATKVRLFGRSMPRKTGQEGLAFLKERLAQLLPELPQYSLKLDHHLCDAILCAYTAFLYSQGKAEALGDAEEGLLYIPALEACSEA